MSSCNVSSPRWKLTLLALSFFFAGRQVAEAQTASCVASAVTNHDPISVTVTQNLAAHSGPAGSGYGYFSGTLTGASSPLPATSMAMWCGDYKNAPIPSGSQTYLPYSSYQSIPLSLAPDPTALAKVNWILNNKQGTVADVQTAIWSVLTNTPAAPSALDPGPAKDMATAADGAFVPGTGQVYAVFLYRNGLNPSGNAPGNSQDLLLELPVCCGEIGDFVWKDANHDGLQTPGELGIDGVKLVLKSGATILSTQTTQNQGKYLFNGLCAGTYSVEVDETNSAAALTGLTKTTTLAGPDRAVDSNDSPTNVTIPDNTLATPYSNLTIDFGYHSPCTGWIGNFVWHDLNNNGIQDTDEPGLVNVKLLLFDSSNMQIATTTTGAGGIYKFDGLCAGTYSVKVDSGIPAGLSPTTVNASGSTTANDSNPNPATTTLDTDTSFDDTLDFGYYSPCTGKIGNFVWHDKDKDGIQDVGEPGINGVTLNLYKNDILVATTTTAMVGGINGYYQFTGLCAGTYKVELSTPTIPSGFSATTANAPGSNTSNDSNPSPFTVVLPDGANDQTIDFGVVIPCTGEIGDFVWLDINGNGIQDSGEPGVAGVVVNLRDAGSNKLLATTTTDVNGYYKFTGRCKDCYKVEICPPNGLSLTKTGQGTPSTDSNSNPTSVTLTADNSKDLTIDFGLKGCAQIGNFVWNDKDKDGIQDYGEPGIPGVTVQLLSSTGTLLRTTTTDSNGKYLFSNVAPGSYQVKVIDPTGYTITKVTQGSNTAVDSNQNPTPVTVGINTSNLTIDFGYYKNGQTITVCSLSYGYWKTHSSAWKVSSLTLGSKTYNKSQLLSLLGESSYGDASMILAKQLIAAKLNVANGATNSSVASWISQADTLLSGYSGYLDYDVSTSSTKGKSMTDLADKLEGFNTTKGTNCSVPGDKDDCDR